MLIEGTRADDLARTGLVTKQRWAVPLWASVLGLLLAGLLRLLAGLLVWAWRHPVTTGIAAVLTYAYARAGLLGLAAVYALGIVALVVWARLWPEPFDRLVTQRLRGSWRWATRYRRLWYPALHGSGLSITTPDKQVYVPLVTAISSTPVVDTLHVRLLHGHTPADLSVKAEGLRHAFTAHRCKVVEDAPGRVRVLFYAHDPLTVTVPAIDPAAVPDLVNLARLHVGTAEDGEPYHLRVQGGHILIIGATNSGKGSALWSPIRAMAPAVHAGLIELNGIDPKRMELVFAPRLFTRLETRIAEGVGLLEALVERMQARQDRLSGVTRDHVASIGDPTVVTVIDELASLTAYCTDRDLKKRTEAALSLLLSQGRAVGFHVLAAGQDPRKEVVAFRDLFPTRIALRTTESSHVDMILGEGSLDAGATCHTIPDTMPGVGFVKVEGIREPVRVRFAYVSDDDLHDMNERWAAPLLQDWRQAA